MAVSRICKRRVGCPGRCVIDRMQVTCIFFEPQFDGRVAFAPGKETGAGVGFLYPMGSAAPQGPGQYRLMLLDMADSFRNCGMP